MLRALAGVAALLALAALPAMAQDTPESGQGTVTMDPGRVVHPLPANLAKGEAMAYDWEVTEPAGGRLYFSTHIHIGDRLVNLSEEVIPGDEGRLVADRDGAYSLLWENRSNDTVVLTYSYHVVRSAGDAGSKPAPLPAAAALAGLAVAALALGARRRRGGRGSS